MRLLDELLDRLQAPTVFHDLTPGTRFCRSHYIVAAGTKLFDSSSRKLQLACMHFALVNASTKLQRQVNHTVLG